MTILIDTRTGPVVQADGAADQPLRQGRLGSLIVCDGHGRFFEQTMRKNVFSAFALGPAAPVAYTNATGIGGPLLWNGSSNVLAVLLAVGYAAAVVGTTANTVMGITGNTGQTSAPTTTTAIDARGNNFVGGQASACTPYRLGTVVNAGNFFLPFANNHLAAALTVDTTYMTWFEPAGALIVPPNAWIAVGSSAAATAFSMHTGFVWEEVPV